MSKRIDVFTEELKKVWTILQQQQVMINAIKDNINAIDKNATDIDSVQDLTKVTKAKNGTTIYLGTGILTFNGSIWKDSPGGNAVTSVSDIVTTI